MATVIGAPEPGLHLVGEYRGVRQGRAWTGKDGIERQPWTAAVLLGDSVIKVEYRSEDDARAATEGVMDGDQITLRVFARAYGGRVYYSGRNLRRDAS